MNLQASHKPFLCNVDPNLTNHQPGPENEGSRRIKDLFIPDSHVRDGTTDFDRSWPFKTRPRLGVPETPRGLEKLDTGHETEPNSTHETPGSNFQGTTGLFVVWKTITYLPFAYVSPLKKKVPVEIDSCLKPAGEKNTYRETRSTHTASQPIAKRDQAK